MSEVLFPVGRMIGGSVYRAQPELDNFKKPKLNADGTPKTAFNFGVAIPKAGEQHWSQTPWGAQVAAVGTAAHQQLSRSPTYAWKIVDGDSTIPNKAGRVPAEQEAYRGCWIVWFKQSWAPKLVTDRGTVQLIELDQIMPGFYVEVFATVVGNGNSPSPGVYLNPMAVNRVAFGERLATASVDTTSVGFGAGPVPAGASATPIGGGFNPAAMAQGGLVTPHVPTYAAPVQQAAQVQQAAPNPAFLQVPPVVVPPQPPVATPPAPPAPPVGPVMTAKAGGATYDQMKGAGWSDALMREHGYTV